MDRIHNLLEETPDYRPVTDGGISTGSSCDYCGEHVSNDFARVFSYNDGKVGACTDCAPNNGIEETARERREKGEV